MSKDDLMNKLNVVTMRINTITNTLSSTEIKEQIQRAYYKKSDG